LFLFDQAKRNRRRAESPIDTESIFYEANLQLLLLTSFPLMEKKQKIKNKRSPPGVCSAHRAWVLILQTAQSFSEK